MLELLQQISARDAEGAFNAVLKIIKPPRDIDIASLKKEYEDNLNVWYNGLDIPTLDFHEKTVTKLLMSNIASLQKNKITLPNVVVQFYRCIILLESVALSLDPQKTILSEIEYFFRDYEFNIIMEKISIRGRIKTIKNYVRFFLTLPEKLEALLTKTLTADLNVRPYINNFFKGVLMVLNTVSYLLLGIGAVVVFMKIFNPGMQQIWNFNVGLVILYLFSAGLLLRLVKRHISIEFR
jgi:predicted unusual protein kinase regulating ubiquinone biosynthesis (AarF/ABC1/UbiB family)